MHLCTKPEFGPDMVWYSQLYKGTKLFILYPKAV